MQHSLSPLTNDLITLAQQLVQHLDTIQDMRNKKGDAVKINVAVLRYYTALSDLFSKTKAINCLIEQEIARFESLDTVNENEPITHQTQPA